MWNERELPCSPSPRGLKHEYKVGTGYCVPRTAGKQTTRLTAAEKAMVTVLVLQQLQQNLDDIAATRERLARREELREAAALQAEADAAADEALARRLRRSRARLDSAVRRYAVAIQQLSRGN